MATKDKVVGPGKDRDRRPSPDSQVPPIPDELISDDGYDAFFDDPQGVAFVEVIRLTPETWGGNPVKGYLGRLNPGESLQTIKENWGGGRFRLNKRDSGSGRIVQTILVDVAGAPSVVSPSGGASPASTAVVAVDPAHPRTFELDVNGTKVPLPLPDGSWAQQLVSVLTCVRAVDAMFPKPVDLNSLVLQSLLDKKQTDPLETVRNMAETAELLGYRRNGGGSDGGDVNGWTILNTAIEKAGDVIGNLTRNAGAGGRPVRRPMPAARPTVQALPDSADDNNTNPNPESEEAAPMNDLQVAMAMLGECVKAFSLDPPKEPARVVRMLDQMFRLDKPQRERLSSFRETGFDIAENQLVEVFEEVPERRAEFEKWYYEVFDLFVNPDRQVKAL